MSEPRPAAAKRTRSKVESSQAVRVDPRVSARAAGLKYVSDDGPGIGRVATGKSGGFRYVGADGKSVKDRDDLARIKSLAIPPAWTEVWICPKAEGHLQATGRDARGRKQYRYHPGWRATRDETKYGRMMAFGQALPTIRRRVDADLKLDGLPRAKVLATIVRLLETTLIRVGNEEYARTNQSFGLTTMRDRHVKLGEGRSAAKRGKGGLTFAFKGKSGVTHAIELADERLARVVKRCRDVPGQALFQYLDESGGRHAVGSADVNEYLREASGSDFTAKDFRTWAGTVLASLALREFEAFDSEAQAKKNVLRAIESVAQRLGNTPSVCRKCYVHPEVIGSYLDGSLMATLKDRADETLRDDLGSLRPEEAAVLGLLRARLARG